MRELFRALEYEASKKSPKIYTALFKKYYDFENISAVFYLCQNDQIKKLLMNSENETNPSNSSKVYMITLNEFNSSTDNLSFVNKVGDKIVLSLGPKLT